jgi:hypothetical protein
MEQFDPQRDIGQEQAGTNWACAAGAFVHRGFKSLDHFKMTFVLSSLINQLYAYSLNSTVQGS